MFTSLGGGQYNETLQLYAFLLSLNGPVIVTGDFNSVPTDPAIVHLQSKMQGEYENPCCVCLAYVVVYLRDFYLDSWLICGSGDGYTFNSSTPFERIDFQFTSLPNGFFNCQSATVPDTESSDHRPVLIEYQL